MKFSQALELLEQGNMVRCVEWKNKHLYLNLHSRGSCINFNSDDIFSQWEEYKEPEVYFGPERAMHWLTLGMRLKRKTWREMHYIFRKETEIMGANWASPQSEWFNDDWHLCDENGKYIPEPK